MTIITHGDRATAIQFTTAGQTTQAGAHALAKQLSESRGVLKTTVSAEGTIHVQPDTRNLPPEARHETVRQLHEQLDEIVRRTLML